MDIVVLAHYGGIDEIAVFVVPIVITLLLLRWAERRVRRRNHPDSESESELPSQPDDSEPSVTDVGDDAPSQPVGKMASGSD